MFLKQKKKQGKAAVCCVLTVFLLLTPIQRALSVPGVCEDTIYDYTDFDTITKGKGLKIFKHLQIESPSVKNFAASYQRQFIMGTANPKKELFLNGQLVTRRAKNGCFGVLVNLVVGKNVFRFTQEGEEPQTVNLFFKTPVVGEAERFRERTEQEQSQEEAYKEVTVSRSAWPMSSVVIRDKTLNLFVKSATAKWASARVAGQTITLTSSAAGQFFGKLDLTNLIGQSAVKSLGKVTYTLFDGEDSTEVESAGNIVYAEPGITELMGRVTSVHASVLKGAPGNFDVLSVLKKGAEFVAEIGAGCGSTKPGAFSGSYVKIPGVGYISASDMVFLSAKRRVGGLSGLGFKAGARLERLTIASNCRSAFLYSFDLAQNRLGITFTSTKSTISPGEYQKLLGGSRLIEDLEVVENPNNTVTFLFTFKDLKKLWGFNIEYTKKKNIVIYFKKQPKLGPEEAPFKHLKIALDPGHGGLDPGAVETPCSYKESRINLSNAMAVKERLESLGATVIMTRGAESEESSKRVSFDERFRESEREKPDFYISLHANSTELNKDLNETQGMEIYYYYPQSYKFAHKLGACAAKYTKRKLRKVEKAAYIVALQTYCPALLFEMGYLTNPVEYEKMCSRSGMFNLANAVSDSIIAYLEEDEDEGEQEPEQVS